LPRLVKTTLVLALASVATGALITGSAGAGTAAQGVVNTKVTISDQPKYFHGRVLADTNACQRERRVKLFLQKQSSNKLLGKDTTNNKLRWAVQVKPPAPGAYFAKVITQVRGGKTCDRDKTRTIVLN
jgi:hypothetical protein